MRFGSWMVTHYLSNFEHRLSVFLYIPVFASSYQLIKAFRNDFYHLTMYIKFHTQIAYIYNTHCNCDWLCFGTTKYQENTVLFLFFWNRQSYILEAWLMNPEHSRRFTWATCDYDIKIMGVLKPRNLKYIFHITKWISNILPPSNFSIKLSTTFKHIFVNVFNWTSWEIY